MQHPPPSTPPPSNHHHHQLKPTTTTATTLLSLLRQRRTQEAYSLFSSSYLVLKQKENENENEPLLLPCSTSLSRLVAQLSYDSTPASFSRAQSVVHLLISRRQLHLLDSNSLGLLAVSASNLNNTPYALSLIHSLLRSSFLPHLKAWSAVLSRLSKSDPSQSLALFDCVSSRLRELGLSSPIISDSRPDTGAFNAALNACANLGEVGRFCEVFDEMREWECKPDVLTYNVVIKMCARAGRRELVGFVLERILHSGLVPCATTMHSLVAAYVGFGEVEIAERLVQCLREGRLDLCTALRRRYSEEEDMEMEGGSDGRMLEKIVEPRWEEEAPLLPKSYVADTRIYTILMKGYMKEGRLDDVVRMVRAMQREPDKASHPDEVTYTTVVSALVSAGEMDRAANVLDEMRSAGVAPNRVTYNVLLKGYCHQLQLDEAKRLMDEMAGKAGIEPNVVSYNTLIDGCVMMDDGAGALKYFNEMRERGIAPSAVSYTTLMKAFALSGQPKLAHKVFDEMGKDPRVKVDRVAWNMLVEGYCRLGMIEEGKKIVERMKEQGFRPDVATYGSLANGIGIARRPGEALLLWNEVKERCKENPPLKPDEGLLDALADVCVRAAFFKKALEVVACMEDNGISPNKTKYKRIYVEMHSRMFTSKHASRARQERRSERKRAAEAFKFWLGLPNSYYGSEWRIEPMYGEENG